MARKKAVSQLIYGNNAHRINREKIDKLIELGYTRQQAVDWIRKENIQLLFDRNEKIAPG